ncbi:MAG: PD-(D/E)XK nuclease family protein, partial [Lachnospiraceae bacterium]|nr:PD-(D/E)XK nuclease family protein [Lachnospiraceae bacterium]
RLMPAEYSPMDTDWTVNEPNALSGVYKYEPDLCTDDNGKPISYGADHDVDAVVDLVDRLVDNEHCFIEEPVRNDDGTFGVPALRKIQYSDIMIICKTTTKMKNYVEKFAKYGIPVNVQGKFTVTSDEVLRNFALLVEYFAGAKNRKKRLTAAQILCGLDATGVSKDELEKAEEELRKLRAYFRDNSMDPAAIVRYLLSREDLFLPKGKEQKIERVREYRIRINQMAETCLANNDGDISRLSMLLDEYMEKEIKREIPLESNENAVRLMNVHQAKGLTGQIVIIADRSNTEKCWYSGFKSSGKYYPTVHFKQGSVENSGSIIYPVYGWDMTRLLQAYREETSEAIRLQYVAATRAAHALIIMPAVYQEAWFTNEIYDYDSLPDINAWIDERENDATDYNPASLNPASAHATLNLQALEANKASADIEKLSESRLASITPSGLEVEGLTGYSSAESGYVKEIRPAGGVFGTVMHRVFELMFIRYDMLEKMSAKEREKAIGRLINLAILESMDDMGKDDVPADMAAFLGSKMPGLYESVVSPVMADAAEIYPEYAFSFFVDDNERSWFDAKFGPFIVKTGKTVPTSDEPVWINGQTDLAIKMKDGSIKVLDFKSDAMNGKPASEFEASLDSKYEGQLELYKYAIGKSFGVTDVQTELVHLYR